jgi:hypothetical protein
MTERLIITITSQPIRKTFTGDESEVVDAAEWHLRDLLMSGRAVTLEVEAVDAALCERVQSYLRGVADEMRDLAALR